MTDIDYEVAHGIACIELAKSRAEIARLQAAKREALKGADERSAENCKLRQENERLRAAIQWQPIETAPKDEMFIWACRWDGRWRLGLAYRNVSGGWSDAYGERDASKHATHWAALPAPP